MYTLELKIVSIMFIRQRDIFCNLISGQTLEIRAEDWVIKNCGLGVIVYLCVALQDPILKKLFLSKFNQSLFKLDCSINACYFLSAMK
jgi:hypothetical protein